MPTLPPSVASTPHAARSRSARSANFAGQTLLPLLDTAVKTARLRFAFPDVDYDVGRNESALGASEPDFVLRISDPTLLTRIATQGSLGLAESYMDGGWEMAKGSLEGFLLALLTANILSAVHASPAVMLRVAALRLRQKFVGTAGNSRAHYDIGDDLYAAFLDETRGYTCGYQRTPDDDNRTLQENKYDRICKKIHLRHDDTLYDLGCGYGGLLIFAAQHYGVRGTGITNSINHGQYAGARAKTLGVADRITIHTGDVSDAQGTYDRVVSVGCFEHLFHKEHDRFFATFRRLMAPGGYGLLHTLGCVTRKNTPDPFIQKYIFPGSAQNPLSRLVDGFERHRLPILDVENVGRHYHPTTVRWLEAFRANRASLDRTRYDERFLRMWELYLAAGTAASYISEGAVWQVVVTNTYRRPLPLHRIGQG